MYQWQTVALASSELILRRVAAAKKIAGCDVESTLRRIRQSLYNLGLQYMPDPEILKYGDGVAVLWTVADRKVAAYFVPNVDIQVWSAYVGVHDDDRCICFGKGVPEITVDAVDPILQFLIEGRRDEQSWSRTGRIPPHRPTPSPLAREMAKGMADHCDKIEIAAAPG